MIPAAAAAAPSDSLPDVFLLGGRDRRVAAGHPWVYANEVRMDPGATALAAGGLVALRRVDGKPLGVGTFNPHTLICFRLLSAAPGAIIDEAYLANRLARALALRERLYPEPFYRLVHGEADGLPGLVVDRFGDALVVQTATAGMDALLPLALSALDGLLSPAQIIVRNDGAFRRLESLESFVRQEKGRLDGPVAVAEGPYRFLADLLHGQKSGWFFDQRDNRAFVAGLAAGATVLDAYCYTGGFGLAAVHGGAASALLVDSSQPALDLARTSAEAQGVAARCVFERGAAFDVLERLAAEGQRFDVVVADPPAFVKSRKDLKPGLRGYRKMARLGAAVVAPGGYLFVASCSHNVDGAAFAAEMARGFRGAGRSGRILRASGAGPDHPIHPHLPESTYVTTLTLQMD